MASDDWRLRIELPEGARLFDIDFDLHDEARELARALKGRRLAVSRNGDEVFLYAASPEDLAAARDIAVSELRAHEITPVAMVAEHWLTDEDRWDTETPGPDVEEDLLERGFAPWEVRVEASSHREARELADRLEAEGYSVERRWRYVLVGATTREEAERLAASLHGEVEAGGELVWEVAPHNPFAWFGGLGGSGTPM